MTKKDFELIAAVLIAARAYVQHSNMDFLSRAFADALATTNKQFNRDKFLRACGCPAN